MNILVFKHVQNFVTQDYEKAKRNAATEPEVSSFYENVQQIFVTIS